jgi:hypothetical protein
MPKTISLRSRFSVEHNSDGEWDLIDWKTGGVVCFLTKAEANDFKRFSKEYVKRHGDINFQSFPMDLDQPLSERDYGEIRECVYRTDSNLLTPEAALKHIVDMATEFMMGRTTVDSFCMGRGMWWFVMKNGGYLDAKSGHKGLAELTEFTKEADKKFNIMTQEFVSLDWCASGHVYRSN